MLIVCYRSTVLILHTCDGVSDYMRVAARHGGRFVFFKSSYIGGVPPGYPPKPLKTAKNGHFGYPPKIWVFGVQNARMAGLVHLLFRIFRKILSLIRGGGPPHMGGPPYGGPPHGGCPHQRQNE
jgi:hypothetical protein